MKSSNNSNNDESVKEEDRVSKRKEETSVQKTEQEQKTEEVIELEIEVIKPEIRQQEIAVEDKEINDEESLDIGNLNEEKSDFKTDPATPEIDEEQNPAGEKIKFEPIIIERRKVRKIEKPKVNIFLEDSDEVDEFENANIITTLEVKSKWSSPDASVSKDNEIEFDDDKTKVFVPKTIESKDFNDRQPEIPVVVESPEQSPVLNENIFESSSTSMCSNSPSTGANKSGVKNVCSFLSDIESEGYLSGLSVKSGFSYDDDDDDKTRKDFKMDSNSFISNSNLFQINNTEPDTTIEKSENKFSLEKTGGNSDSDSDESESSSSSESSSDSSSESEEESSDNTSDEETTAVVNRFGGFGRFDATSMPMVTQIKAATTQAIAVTPETPTTSRFQPHQSVIRPPGLLTNLTKPILYTPAMPAQQMISTPFMGPSPIFGQAQFPIPFKIYSLRDAGSGGLVFPSVNPTVFATPETFVSSNKEKVREKDRRTEKRDRDRHRSRSHSRDRERDRKKFKEDRRDSERRRTPTRRRSVSPKKRSVSPRKSPKRRSPSPLKRKHSEDKRESVKKRDHSPKHSSHSSRSSHNPR